MNFKQALEHDARTVFCNPDEFGKTVVLDGITTVAVISDDTTVTNAMLENPFAVRPQLCVSVCASDFPANYPEGRTVTMNGLEYYIMHKQHSGALLVLTLQHEA